MMWTDDLQRAALDGLRLLVEITGERLSPRDAIARVTAMAALHPGVRLELVWELEPYDAPPHYDLLVFTDEGGCLSLAATAAQATPWPLRGAVRVSDADLVRVNGRIVRVTEAMAYLDIVWREQRLVSRIVDTAIINAELEARPTEVSDEELQEGMDAFRAARGLLSPEETEAWLARNCLTLDRLEGIVELECQVAQLRTRIAGDRVEARFHEQPDAFRSVVAAVVRVPTRDEAWAFAEAAERCGFLGAAEAEAARCAAAGSTPAPLFQAFDGRSASLELRPLLDAEVGAVLPPIPSGGGYVLAKIIARRPASLDAMTRRWIEDTLFDQWLAERRDTADIEWYWGDTGSGTDR